jgi:hypothetical protein
MWQVEHGKKLTLVSVQGGHPCEEAGHPLEGGGPGVLLVENSVAEEAYLAHHCMTLAEEQEVYTLKRR